MTTDVDAQLELLQKVESLINQGLEGRKNSKVLLRAEKFDDYMWGDHPVKSLFDRKGKTYNKLAEIVETRVAHLTDNRPKWVFGPQEEGDLFTSRALNQILGDYLWDKIEWDDKGEDAVIEAAASGSCHIKAGFDPISGWPTFTVVPSEAIIVDDKAIRHSQVRFIGHFIAKSPEYVLKEYGVNVIGEADFNQNNAKSSSFKNPQLSYQQRSGGYNVPVPPLSVRNGRTKGGAVTDVMKQAVLCELWFDDPTLEAIPYNVEETNSENLAMGGLILVTPKADQHHPKHIKAHEEFLGTLDPDLDGEVIALAIAHIEMHRKYKQATKRYKYPYGRIVTVCQGKLLVDKPNKMAEDLKINWRRLWIKFDYTKSRAHYWGKPLAHDLFDPQDDFNIQQNFIIQNIKLLGNGIRKWRRGRFNKEELKRVVNLIGKNVLVDDPTDLTVDYGPTMPAHHFANRDFIPFFMDKQAGQTDVLGGSLPKGSPAGVTVDQLIQTGSARLRLALRHYTFALNWMAYVAIQIMIEYVDPAEEFEILGENGEVDVKQWRDLRDKIRGSKAMKNIRVDARSINASARRQDQEMMMRLGEIGYVDRQAVLEVLDIPNKYATLKRMNEIEMLKAQLQQAGEIIDNQNKEINTYKNRQQKEEGAGNVGIPTSR